MNHAEKFGVYKMIDVDELTLDPGYQRDHTSSAARTSIAKIVKNYNPVHFGVLAVSEHDGTLSVWDGGHRLAAAVQKGFLKVPCVVTQQTPEESALSFARAQNNGRSLSALDRHRAEIVGKLPEALQLQSAMKSVNWGLKTGAPSVQTTSAVAACEQALFVRENLEQTLEFLSSTWPISPEHGNFQLIKGVSRFLARATDLKSYNEKSLQAKLCSLNPLHIKAPPTGFEREQFEIVVVNNLVRIHDSGRGRGKIAMEFYNCE